MTILACILNVIHTIHATWEMTSSRKVHRYPTRSQARKSDTVRFHGVELGLPRSL